MPQLMTYTPASAVLGFNVLHSDYQHANRLSENVESDIRHQHQHVSIVTDVNIQILV